MRTHPPYGQQTGGDGPARRAHLQAAAAASPAEPALDLRSLFEAAPAPYLVLTRDLVIAAVNDAYLHATLTVREQILGRPLFEVFPDNRDGSDAEGAGNLRASLDRVVRNRAPDRMPLQTYDIRVPAPDGRSRFEARYWRPLNTPVFDAQGELTHIIHWIEDMTDAHTARGQAGALAEALESAERSEARFREIANALPQIVWTAEPDGTVDWFNDWWYAYTGAAAGSQEDERAACMHPDDVRPTRRRWAEAIASGQACEMEYRLRRRGDGQYRWHLGRAIPMRDASARIVRWIGCNTDIHDQKQIESDLKEERRLRERLTNALAHDLRTPLGTATMAAQVLQRHMPRQARWSLLLDKVVHSLVRIDEMITDMLDASVMQAGQSLEVAMDDCELDLLARNAVDDLVLVHGDRIVLQAEEHVRGFWSCDGLRRVLENLVVNALKYGAPQAPVTVIVAHDGERVQLAVHNHGRPLSDAERASLFQLFRRSTSAEASCKAGWGIGLTVVKGIVEAHRGELRVASDALAGTTFTVDLPRDARRGATT